MPDSLIAVGDARISRIEELLMPTSMRWLFPDFPDGRDLVARNRDWLAPHFTNERGHLLQSIHTFGIKVDGLTVVVDTCVGNDKQRPGGAPEWQMRSGPFLDRLSDAGFAPLDVDVVICTHLHVDHVGWNTRLVDGRWLPTFPNARYLFVDREWEHWQAQAREDDAVRILMDDSVRPVIDAGRADLVPPDHRISASLTLEPSPGHTPGHASVRISSDGHDAVLSGDVMHSPVQCAAPDARPLFDHDPVPAREARHTFLERYADSGVLVLGAHFNAPSAGRIERDGAAYRFTVAPHG